MNPPIPTKGKKDYQFNKADYAKMAANWPMLEESSRKGCQCNNPGCDKMFTEDNPMEMGVDCHRGSPLWVSYWDGWLYIRCAVCDKPVVRIPVGTSLL